MAPSRASTNAGRRRAQAKSAHRTRAATPKTGDGTRRGASKRAAPKAKAPKPKSPKAARAKPKPRAKTSRPKQAPAKQPSRSRAVTIAFVAATAAIGLGAAYFFWFRDSTFVQVERVVVEGIDGPEAAAVSEALTQAGQGMTTLNVDESELAAAVSRYPTAIAIETETDFPHGLTVRVIDRPPVLNASDGGPPVPVSEDGTLLHGVDTSEASLPALDVESLPSKGKLTGEPLALARVAGAAPEPLSPLIDGLEVEGEEGIEVTLKGGIPVRFGDADEAVAKWAAVSAILANPKVKTFTQLDVRVPERPSIAGAAPPSESE